MKTTSRQNALIEMGVKLKMLRQKKGFMNCDDFAKKYDLPKAYYRNMEEARVNFTITSLLRVLEIHKMNVEDFFCMDITKKAA